MKFEYELNYDFVNEKLTFKVTKMVESLRHKGDIKSFEVHGSDWWVKSYGYPDITKNNAYIYLPGRDGSQDDSEVVISCDNAQAITISKVLKEFQSWVENEYVDPNERVEMTVAEIEEKLGIKNLKIVKEVTRND